MVFCGAGNSTIQIAEEAAEAVNKMLTSGMLWDEDEEDMNLILSYDTVTCNTNEAHGTFSSHLDLGNLDMPSLDAFAEKIRLSTLDIAKDRLVCNWAWCGGKDLQTEEADIVAGLTFVPYEHGDDAKQGKENNLNDQTRAASSSRTCNKKGLQSQSLGPHAKSLSVLSHPQKSREEKHNIEHDDSIDVDDANMDTGYPSEIVLYKPNRIWVGLNSREPDLRICWSVDRNLEKGQINQWSGTLIKDNTEIGWITMYVINQRIAQKPRVDDPAVVTFVEDYILTVNNPSSCGEDDASVRGSKQGLRHSTSSVRSNIQRRSSRLSSEGGGIMTLSTMLAIGPIFLITDLTIQPDHRGSGLGLYLLDAASRRVAESFSLVIVSLREAINETLNSYFGLLGFTLLDKRQDFAGRRNGPHCPCVEEICPYLPTPAIITLRGSSPPQPQSPRR